MFDKIFEHVKNNIVVIEGNSNYVELPLSNSSLKTIIDKEDVPKVLKYPWFLKKDKRTGVLYVAASRRIGDTVETIRLHRFVMNASPNMDVHHKNLNPLDNRKENLEVIPKPLHRRFHVHREPVKVK